MNQKNPRSPHGYTIECPVCGLALGALLDGVADFDAPCPRCGEEAAIMFPPGYDEPSGYDEQGLPLPSPRDRYELTKPLGLGAMIEQAEAAAEDAGAAAWPPPERRRDEYEPGL